MHFKKAPCFSVIRLILQNCDLNTITHRLYYGIYLHNVVTYLLLYQYAGIDMVYLSLIMPISSIALALCYGVNLIIMQNQ